MSSLSAILLATSCVLLPLGAQNRAPAPGPSSDATVSGVEPCPREGNLFLLYWDDVQNANGVLEVRDSVPAQARRDGSGIDYSFDDGRTWARAEGGDPWVVRFRPERDTEYRLRVRTYDADNPRALPGRSHEWRIRVVDRSRTDEVQTVFEEMIRAYERHDERGFMRHVSRDEFTRDYLVMQRAMRNEFRALHAVRIDAFVDRVTPNGNERTVLFRWTKQWEDRETGELITYRGRTEFRFREIDCAYLLVDYRGDVIFGHTDTDLLPVADLTVTVTNELTEPPPLATSMFVRVRNDGDAIVQRVEVRIFASPPSATSPITLVDTRFVRLAPGEEEEVFSAPCTPGQVFRAEIDPENDVVETDETNNEAQAACP